MQLVSACGYFVATVTVGGNLSQSYRAGHGQGNKAYAYFISEDDKNWSVQIDCSEYVNHPDYHDYPDIKASITVDGRVVRHRQGRTKMGPSEGHRARMTIDICEVWGEGTTASHQLRFKKIDLIDSDNHLTAKEVDSLGSINIQLARIKVQGRVPNRNNRGGPATAPLRSSISERLKPGNVSSVTSFGPVRHHRQSGGSYRGTKPNFKFHREDRRGRSFASFEFKYASKDLLEANGIIRRISAPKQEAKEQAAPPGPGDTIDTAIQIDDIDEVDEPKPEPVVVNLDDEEDEDEKDKHADTNDETNAMDITEDIVQEDEKPDATEKAEPSQYHEDAVDDEIKKRMAELAILQATRQRRVYTEQLRRLETQGMNPDIPFAEGTQYKEQIRRLVEVQTGIILQERANIDGGVVDLTGEDD